VITLEQELKSRLDQKQAREYGICPIREELFQQCFDELIRQITIDCKDRGLLLVKVRDEMKTQIEAYRRLYESSIAFGMRKMLNSENEKALMTKKIFELEKETNDLQKSVEELEKKIDETKKVETEKMKKDKTEHETFVNNIKEYLSKGRDQLEKLLCGTKD